MSLRCIAVLVLCAAVACAQEASPAWQMFRQNVKQGDRIRIETSGKPVSGRVERVTGDAVSVRAGRRDVSDFKSGDVVRVYKLGGKTRHTAKWTAIGLGVGAGAGAATGAAVGIGSDYRVLAVALFAVIGAIGGLAAGAIIGASSSNRTLVYQRP